MLYYKRADKIGCRITGLSDYPDVYPNGAYVLRIGTYPCTTSRGEVTIKWVEAIQTKLPMCIGGAIFGAARLRPKQRDLYRQYYLPWAIETGHNSEFLMNIYFEKRWDQQVSDIYKELNIKEFTGPKTKKLNKNYLS